MFFTWVGDHSPRHVHIYCDDNLVLKWDLQKQEPMEGIPSRRLLKLIRELEAEGRL